MAQCILPAHLDLNRIDEWLMASGSAIPMLPALANQVIELAADPEIQVGKLTGVISKDQVLASRLLGMANSALCAPLMKISTVNEAIVRLGTSAARNLVITGCFASQLHDPGIYGPAGPALAEHAIGTAYAAQLIAVQIGDEDPDEAFLCGLLHDIGKLVILKMAYDEGCRGRSIPSEERSALIASWHAIVGGLALTRWHLPVDLDDAVMYHHDYGRAERDPSRAGLTYLANRLSHRYGFGCEPDRDDLAQDPVWELLQITPTWLASVDQRLPGLFKVARDILC